MGYRALGADVVKITSPSNPKIKRLVKLKNRKTREQSGLSLVDGFREVSRAREAGLLFEEFYICPELLNAFGGQKLVDEINSWRLEPTGVSAGVFEKISFGERKEGVIAVIRTPRFPLDAAALPPDPLIVVLENIEKPGNLGAILRTCDAAGVDAVIIADTKTDILNPNVIRASTGIVFSSIIMQATGLQVRDFLKQNGCQILAATPAGKQSHFLTDLRGGIAFVLGSEDQGLSQMWLDSADVLVAIPMKGKADSLNVSATAAVLVYESLRQRRY
ncbi:MAG: RNA methyltransferase [Candidatus Omnitrophota bacterium]